MFIENKNVKENKKIIIANWKMYGTYDFAIEYFEKISNLFLDKNLEIVICPPLQFINLGYKILTERNNKQVVIGAQNVSHLTEIASTGEINVKMLEECGAKTVIIGHSERRAICDSNGYINEKIKNLQSSSIRPILCIGENVTSYESGETKTFLKNQIETALQSIKKMDNLIVAYEPIWAIGTGKTPIQEDITTIAEFIKETVNSICKVKTLNVIYGGSVNDKNLHKMLQNKKIDGVLIGGFSLKIEEFCKTLEDVRL